MITPQPPSLAVFISAQTMLFGDMPTQCFPSKAAVQTNHIITMYGLSHRHGGSANFLGLTSPSKLTERLMYRCDEF